MSSLINAGVCQANLGQPLFLTGPFTGITTRRAGWEVKHMKKTIIHTDPQDKDKQSRIPPPSEVVTLEK